MERSFKKEVQSLQLGDGETFHGEGILAVTKALLQSGVSYVGGYQGAPVSHLLDVMVEAEDLLADLGVHVETCTNEASAAAMLGASINYPLRGAVTWKSIVGTNVAADALSNLASPGVIGGAHDHHRRGLRRRRERHPGALLRLCAEILDVAARSAPRSADHRAHGREGLRAVGGEPRAGDAGAAHPRLPRHRRVRGARTTARPLIRATTASTARRASNYAGSRIRPSPSCRSSSRSRSACRPRAPSSASTSSTRSCPATSTTSASSCWAGSPTACCARSSGSASPTCSAPRASRSMSSTSSIRWCRRRSASFCAGKRAVLVVEEGYPDYIEQAINVELRRADIQTRVLGKDVLPQAGEYTSDVLLKGLAAFLAEARPAASTPTRSARARKAMLAHRPAAAARRRRPAAASADLLHRLPGAAGVLRDQADAARDRADPHQRRYRLPFVRDVRAVQPRQLDPRLRHVARERGRGRAEPREATDRGHGRRRLLA